MKEYCTCISKQHLTTTSPPLQPRDPSTICKKKIVQSPRLAQLTPQSPSCSCAFPAAPGLCRGHHERPRASHTHSLWSRVQLLCQRTGSAAAPHPEAFWKSPGSSTATVCAFSSTTGPEVAAEARAPSPLFILCNVRKVLKST